MPLLDLKTNLKSLKYGQDQPDGGSSGQPYIKTDINTADTDFNRFRLTKFDDGLVRGGVIGALNASVVDTLRIGKFFIDFPKGPLFIIKQVGLQLSNPRLEVPKNPANIAAGAPDNALAASTKGLLQPTRVYNLGINTLAQIPLNAAGGHIMRHGILPIPNEASKYEAVVKANNDSFNISDPSKNNRLVELSRKFQLGDNSINRPIGATADRLNQITSAIGALTGVSIPQLNKPIDTIIDDYNGGASSVYGIGRTLIRRYSNTEDGFKINLSRQFSSQFAGKTRDINGNVQNVSLKSTFDYGLSNKTQSTLASGSFTDLPNQINNPQQPLINNIASIADKNGNNVISRANSYSDAAQRAKGKFFYGVSNYSSSLYASGSDLKDNSGILPSLDYRIANKTDIQTGSYSNIYAGNSRNEKGEPVSSQKIIKNNKVGLGVSKQYFSKDNNVGSINYPTSPYEGTYPIPEKITLDVQNGVVTKTPPDIVVKASPIRNVSYKKYQEIIDSRQLKGVTYLDSKQNEVNAFGIYGNEDKSYSPNTLGFNKLPDSNSNISYYNGNSLLTINTKFTWRNITREIRVGSGRQDQINLTPLFDEAKYFGNDTIGTHNIRDLVKFRIQAVNTNNPDSGKWMVFRAYLTDLSDDSTADWQDIKYAGRGDKFYIYTGFTRKINISFKIAALSAEEMQFIYQKLNFLMSNTMPDYENELMRGPLTRLTVGNWVDGQLGILNSVSFKVPQDSPWEIALDEPEGGKKQLILPHVVDVTLSFTPIGAETAGNNLINRKSEMTSYIAQNNTGDTKFQFIGGTQVKAENNEPTKIQSEYVESTGAGNDNYPVMFNENGYI